MAEHSKQVWHISFSEEDNSVELKEFLEAHPDVDVNLHKDGYDGYALHSTAHRGHAASTRLLIDAKADLEVRDCLGQTPLYDASAMRNLDCLQVLIESNADVNTTTNRGSSPAHHAAGNGNSECLHLLINARADVDAATIDGFTPAMIACREDRLACLQLMVDANADFGVQCSHELNSLYYAMCFPTNEPVHRVPGMPFAVLSCNTDIKNVTIDEDITPALITTHTNEYKHVQAFIDDWHSITKHALNEDVVVDKRVGRRGNGIYHEPLEQVLLYLGLSMKKNQTINASIDSKSAVKRALMPGHPTNANLWFELYQRTHCASCSTRLTEPKKKCPCDAARYCNSDCQRQHWQTHKPSHKAVMREKKKEK
jgi:hypothetical protein